MAAKFHIDPEGDLCSDPTPISCLLSPDPTTDEGPQFYFTEKLPDVNSSEAPATAATKLYLLLQYLEKGEVPLTVIDLRKTLSYAAKVLTVCSSLLNSEKRRYSGSSVLQEPLSAVRDVVVREWLSETFTKQRQISQSSPREKLPSFKNVAKTLMIGKYIENIYKDRVLVKALQYPEGVAALFQSLDSWEFAIFKAEALTAHQPLRYIGHELFKRHNLFSEHKISPATLDAFLLQVEKGYKAHQNAYHNETHGADVLQTVHALITSAQLNQLRSLELLAILLAASIHDVDHPGTTNAFQIKTLSDFALCYNDRSVLENHHLQYAFQLLRKEELNILQSLSPEEFSEVRGLVIDMVLATDMSSHFDQIKHMRLLLSAPDSVSQLSDEHRSKALCLLLHMADISHPGKPWNTHSQWTERITEEFFRQGDWEKELALPLSPMCDRNTTLLTESTIGFIDYIVSPIFDVCGDMLELLSSSVPSTTYSRPWLDNLRHNRERWADTDCHTVDTPGAKRDQLRPATNHTDHKHSIHTVSTQVGVAVSGHKQENNGSNRRAGGSLSRLTGNKDSSSHPLQNGQQDEIH